MKSCPTCNRTFADENLSFCIEDGTPLVRSGEPAFDPGATLVARSPAPTAVPPDQGRAAEDLRVPAYQPPGQFGPPPGAGKRRVWPWLVALAIVLLMLAGGVVVLAIFLPGILAEQHARQVERSQNQNYNNTNVNTNVGSTNTNANANTNANTNSAINNANSNSSTPPLTEAPSDPDTVLADLTELEKEWTEANFSADKKALARILADDYVATLADGTIQGKGDYLRDIKPDDTVKDWKFLDLKLTLKGDRATLTGRMRMTVEGKDEDVVVRFTDKFVWRDGRWQAVSSEVSPVK